MKQRNIIQVHCWKRKSGAHGKTEKALRRKDKVQLKRGYDETGNHRKLLISLSGFESQYSYQIPINL